MSATASSSSGSFEVPDGLQELLQDFTVSVLRNRPPNLVHYAATYFRRLDQTSALSVAAAGAKPGVAACAGGGATLKFPREDSGAETDDDEMGSGVTGGGGAGASPPGSNSVGAGWPGGRNRRASVAAPSFDPEKSEATYRRKIVPKGDEQRRRLIEAVKHILLFRSLDRNSLGHVIDAMQELPVLAGDVIIEQNHEGDNFYVIERGVFEAFVTDATTGERRHAVTYNHGGSFGELALMYYCPRAATVVAQTDGVLWSLDLETFQQKVLMSAFKNRKKYEAFLVSVPLLSELTNYERQNVADALKEREYDDGEPILYQGDPGNEMFFVEDGCVKVMRRHSENGLETQVNQLEKGAYFGELSLITKQPRAASCYAVGRTRVCVLHVSDFERLLGSCLEVMRRNIDRYRSQLRDIFGEATPASALRMEASV